MLENAFKYVVGVFIPLFLIGSCLSTITPYNSNPVLRKVDTVAVVYHDTIYVTDTIYTQPKNYFQSFSDIALFVTYLKTQSGRLDEDNWSVIHTLFNRLEKDSVTFREYFNSPSINHSKTIERILANKLKVSYSIDDKTDLAMTVRVVNAYFGYNPTKVPKNVLYFESFKQSPNRGVFKEENLWRKYRHKFYYGKTK